jgi:hypothetical protein
MSEGTLRHKMCPQSLPAEVKYCLGDQVLDSVDQPGGNLTTDGEFGVVVFTEALRNLKGENKIAMAGDTPSSHNYTKCTTLRDICSLGFLQKRYDTLIELRPRLLEAVVVCISLMGVAYLFVESTQWIHFLNRPRLAGCLHWPSLAHNGCGAT